jgi:hypothetical protein
MPFVGEKEGEHIFNLLCEVLVSSVHFPSVVLTFHIMLVHLLFTDWPTALENWNPRMVISVQ